MKKSLSIILAVILLIAPMCIEAYASDGEANYDDLIMPCYDYISSISAGITEGVLGFATCFSNCTSFQADKTFVLTCTMQRTDGSDAWQAYKTTTETFSGKGNFTIEKKWFAPANYAYRVLTTVVVKNSAGTTVETATRSSGVLYK